MIKQATEFPQPGSYAKARGTVGTVRIIARNSDGTVLITGEDVPCGARVDLATLTEVRPPRDRVARLTEKRDAAVEAADAARIRVDLARLANDAALDTIHGVSKRFAAVAQAGRAGEAHEPIADVFAAHDAAQAKYLGANGLYREAMADERKALDAVDRIERQLERARRPEA